MRCAYSLTNKVEEAERYAADNGGTIVPLSCDPPPGYTVDEASGVLVPIMNTAGKA